MVEKFKTLLLQMASYFSIYEIGIVLGIFFVFIMLFLLGLLLRGRRVLPSLFFFLSALSILSTPFVLHLCMQQFLYAIDVEITQAHAMQYTKGFFVAGNITHKGKIAVNECLVAVNEVREEKDSKFIKVLNTAFPKASFRKSIDIDIEPNESAKFALVVPELEGKEPFLYRVYVDCYYSNQLYKKYTDKKRKNNDEILKPKHPAETIDDTQEGEELDSSEADSADNSNEADSESAPQETQETQESALENAQTTQENPAQETTTEESPQIPEPKSAPSETPQETQESATSNQNTPFLDTINDATKSSLEEMKKSTLENTEVAE